MGARQINDQIDTLFDNKLKAMGQIGGQKVNEVPYLDFTLEQKLQTEDVRVHSKNEFPSLVPDEAFSVDVITCDEEGMMNVGFYSYDSQKWDFHTDTLVDYTDMDFVWMYKPDFLNVKQ